MQFWPFAVAPIGSGLVTLCAIALFIKFAPRNLKAKSPHHRWNEETDRRHAAKPRH